MSISKVEKVRIALHKTERAKFLSRLQDESILHISEIKEESETVPLSVEETEIGTKIASLERTISYLRPYTKQSLIDNLFGNKRVIDKQVYQETIGSIKYGELSLKVRELERRESELERKKTQCKTELEEISHWESLNIPVEKLKSTKQVILEPGFVPRKSLEVLDEIPPFLEVEVTAEGKKGAYSIFAYSTNREDDARKFLIDIGFEPIRLEGFTGKPSTIIKQLREKILRIEKEEKRIKEEVAHIAENVDRIFVLYEENYNAHLREKAFSRGFVTSSAVFIEGWIKKSDRKRLKKLSNEFATVTIETIKPKQGESPPCEFENPSGVRPFEALIRLYGMPHRGEIDPTPLIMPFFILFFAICLSDAMYGLIFALGSFLFMEKIQGDRSLLKILLFGAFATIVIGALLGGWFGDLPQRLQPTFPWFSSMRKRFMLFDPMTEPLKFFILALSIGVFQILIGFFVGFITLLKQRRPLEAVASKLSWNIFWISLFLFVGTGYITSLEWAKNIFLIPLAGASLLVVFLSGVPSRNLPIQIAKGIFNLYQGIMGTIGDIISYSRLMALGLVTMGLAMAVNILVEVVSQIPVLKFILVPIVFIAGHLFSIAINVLGAYVHTLRLQYAEFFTKFFEGGGRPFSPLKRETRYVVVESSE